MTENSFGTLRVVDQIIAVLQFVLGHLKEKRLYVIKITKDYISRNRDTSRCRELVHLCPEVAVVEPHNKHRFPQGNAGGVTAAEAQEGEVGLGSGVRPNQCNDIRATVQFHVCEIRGHKEM